jgi:uncharacterized protein (DUF305 family)
MNNKIKLLLIPATGMYFFTSCDNGAKTTSDKDNTDTIKLYTPKNDTINRNDTMNKKMDDIKKNTDGLITSMNKMMDRMSGIKMTGDFDIDFVNMMIEHHQGAINMSEEVLKSGTDDKVKAMAHNIINAQKEEEIKFRDIVKNNKPLKMKIRKHDELSKDIDGMKAKMNGMQMTGNADKDFIMMIILHHEGAIKIFKDELSHGMNNELKLMAKKGISAQTKEINEFKNWLLAHK